MEDIKRKVLVIDDEPGNIKMLYRGLAHIYQILGATSGEEGIETTKTENPDLILLDIQMVGISGYEVLTQLRKDPDTSHIPIIFLSGLDNPEDESYGLELGADDYIAKPFNLAVVRARIKTQLKIVSQKEQIEYLANHCPLTNLANPKLIHNHFNHVLENISADRLLALLYMDLNKFKPINDTYGHDAGDFVLQEVAKRLKEKVAQEGLVGRLGGDEFLLVLHNLENKEAIYGLCADIKSLLAEPILYQGLTLQIGTSIGVAVHKDDGEQYMELRKVADANMYKDKESGKES